jgi:hypothetical protein
MATIRDEYGFEFNGEYMVLDNMTLTSICYSARARRLQANVTGDFAAAYQALEDAARSLLAIRTTQRSEV